MHGYKYKIRGGDGLDYSASLFGITDLYESVESNEKLTNQMANNVRPPEAWYNSTPSSELEDTVPRSANIKTAPKQSSTVSATIDDSSSVLNV
jgi:hypothetical protein